MEAKSIEDNKAKYYFICEGCGCEGHLGIPLDQRGPFACPEDCGATYIQWQIEGNYKLTCVVCPVFKDDAPRLPGD